MRALVTGASGLIGAHVVRALICSGYDVRALVRETSDISILDGLLCEIHHGDVLVPGTLRDAAGSCDLIFHTAVPFAYSGQVDGDVDRIAAEGTANVLHTARATGVTRVVVTSSSVVFGHRTGPETISEAGGLATAVGQPAYVAAKLRQDEKTLELAASLGIEVVLPCPTMTVGPFGTRLGPSNGIVVQYLADPLRMTYPGGVNIAAVEDVASGHVLTAEFGRPFEHYILGSENLSWKQIHEIVADLAGLPEPQMTINHSLSYLGAAFEEARARLERRRPLTTRDQATMVGRFYWYSSAKAAELGYAPRPARVALAGAVAWLAGSPHVSREARITMHLNEEVYAAREAIAAREKAVREVVA